MAADRDGALERDDHAEEAADHERTVQRGVGREAGRDGPSEPRQAGPDADQQAGESEDEQRRAEARGEIAREGRALFCRRSLRAGH
jgi:hypothetical protein